MDVIAAKQHITLANYSPVLALDQLGQQRRLGRVFQGFHEADVTFKPTYKYDPGTDNWDSRFGVNLLKSIIVILLYIYNQCAYYNSEKGRAPAWCDRVLWKGDAITSIDYRSHPELRISDHKPVSAIFDAQVKLINSIRLC